MIAIGDSVFWNHKHTTNRIAINFKQECTKQNKRIDTFMCLLCISKLKGHSTLIRCPKKSPICIWKSAKETMCMYMNEGSLHLVYSEDIFPFICGLFCTLSVYVKGWIPYIYKSVLYIYISVSHKYRLREILTYVIWSFDISWQKFNTHESVL